MEGEVQQKEQHKAPPTPVMCSSCVGDQSHSQVDLTLPDLVAVCLNIQQLQRPQKQSDQREAPSAAQRRSLFPLNHA